MSNNASDNANDNVNDKCDNCGDRHSSKYWDYEDKSVLCDKCHELVGEGWHNSRTESIKEDDDSKNIRCIVCDRDFGSSEALESHNNVKHKNVHHVSSNKLSGKTIAIICVLFLVALVAVSFSLFGHAGASSGGTNINANVVAPQGDVQTATLSVAGSSYILEPSTFKKDVPVRITADISSMPGCSKVVTIPAFSVFKAVTANDNVITFTPTKTGTFRMACTMSMYTTTFTVE